MTQTNQDKTGVLIANPSQPTFATLYALGNRPPSVGNIQFGNGVGIYVATDGDDESGDGSLGAPYKEINKALSVMELGDTIILRAGTYYESTALSAFVSAQTWFSHPCALGLLISGEIDNRCSMIAFPGDEGLVIIDGGGTQVGLHINDQDYWNFYGIRIENCREAGIINNGQVPDRIPNLENLSTGVRIENCLIDGVTGAEGNNISGIGPWGTKDWIIRNLFIKNISAEGSTLASAIQTYGCINMIVEHIKTDAVDFGIFLKDHFVETDSPTTPYAGVEVRYCELKCKGSSINIGIRGSGSCEAGFEYIHHNVMFGFDGTTEEAVQARMGGAQGQSTRVRLAHNIIDITTGATTHFSASAFAQIESWGNILCGGSLALTTLYDDDENAITRITESDYNVYTNFQVIPNRYGANSMTFNDIATWQAATAGTPQHLGLSNPDSHSIVVSASSLFTDRAANDYSYAGGSGAIGLMPDGTNAGAYQLSTEVLGLLPTYSAGV